VQLLFPVSKSRMLERAHRLICATHSLSTYSLTIVRGQPLLPVQIRIHTDPVGLISKLLNSNRKSFLQLEALISISKDLVLGTAPNDKYTTPAEVAEVEVEAEARVIGMATAAALGEEDFETAYAYVTARLLPLAEGSRFDMTVQQRDDLEGGKGDAFVRDTLWRTALLAGQYRSTYAVLSAAPSRGPKALVQMEKKMELLAIAVKHTPKESVSEVLGQWRRCEEEVDAMILDDERAEKAHGQRLGMGMVGVGNNSTIVMGTEADETPQSLFEVARGAARVFSGSGVLASAGGRGRGESAGGQGVDSDCESIHSVRERKRDVVSGMVTRGELLFFWTKKKRYADGNCFVERVGWWVGVGFRSPA
jgi:hypothetical protein